MNKYFWKLTVLLVVFGLVFAGCSDPGSDMGGNGGGRTNSPESVTIVVPPEAEPTPESEEGCGGCGNCEDCNPPCDCGNCVECGNCANCGKTEDNCDCHKDGCGRPKADCDCCEQCGKTEDNCDCHKDGCGKPKTDCDCCEQCGKTEDNCDCHKDGCGKTKADCDCCDKCGKKAGECTCNHNWWDHSGPDPLPPCDDENCIWDDDSIDINVGETPSAGNSNDRPNLEDVGDALANGKDVEFVISINWNNSWGSTGKDFFLGKDKVFNVANVGNGTKIIKITLSDGLKNILAEAGFGVGIIVVNSDGKISQPNENGNYSVTSNGFNVKISKN